MARRRRARRYPAFRITPKIGTPYFVLWPKGPRWKFVVPVWRGRHRIYNLRMWRCIAPGEFSSTEQFYLVVLAWPDGWEKPTPGLCLISDVGLRPGHVLDVQLLASDMMGTLNKLDTLDPVIYDPDMVNLDPFYDYGRRDWPDPPFDLAVRAEAFHPPEST
jgi:hypothetical protein